MYKTFNHTNNHKLFIKFFQVKFAKIKIKIPAPVNNINKYIAFLSICGTSTYFWKPFIAYAKQKNDVQNKGSPHL
ncbi:MAG: hypothetical protein MJ165_00405 [Alphaproteobacteria bacterium]|nr:hypothetical protein [Alphaproteobacteria bacterium]